ncbi:MAG: tRNA 2-thiouridine(34) synthase MnmA [Ktedonobacterales bacterium]|nr:tRNA 2-thiouridine(34) synthase MnmA [Ktedonobacterales bacterium]
MTRVVIAMSGGVDSSVAAALLKQQGYDVIGIMLRLWSEPAAHDDTCVDLVSENKCCSEESVYDARRVAQKLDIPFYLVNVEEPFQKTIVDFFYDEYAAGRTPNPCLRCNRTIRFTLLLERALALGAEYLATGHYVRVDDDPLTGERRLRRAVDRQKDQSYMLHLLNQHQLAHAMFPLGEMTKPEVRALAEEFGLAVAKKADSQEICFVAGNDYRGFVQRYADLRAGRISAAEANVPGLTPGPLLAMDGGVLGEHRGLAYYTVGQRKGLGITAAEPLHVVKLDAARNAVIVGPATALEKTTFSIREVNYPRDVVPGAAFPAAIRIRYKAAEIPATVTPLGDGRAEVALSVAQRAITPGQAAVGYGGLTGDEVLVGGTIE